jgi:hypothetical protein
LLEISKFARCHGLSANKGFTAPGVRLPEPWTRSRLGRLGAVEINVLSDKKERAEVALERNRLLMELPELQGMSQRQKLAHQANILLNGTRAIRKEEKAFESKRYRRARALETKIAVLEARKEAIKPDVTDRYVYIIGADGHPVKIGIALEPEKRLKEIQTGFPHRLRIYVQVEAFGGLAPRVEREAHRMLTQHRLHGEWFDCSPELAEATVRHVLASLA